MKKKLLLTTSLTVLFIVAAALLGCASSPPNRVERGLFDIKTNETPVLEVKTNVVKVPVSYTTNVVPVYEYRTNVVTSTTTNYSYVLTPGPGAQNVKDIGKEVGDIFGVGGIVGTVLGAVFSLWGYVRSKKNYITAANVAQTVETLREFIKTLPNGQVYDSELVNWIQNNQAKAGILQHVLAILEREVSNPEAKMAAAHIRTLIEGIKKQAGEVPTLPTPPAPVA